MSGPHLTVVQGPEKTCPHVEDREAPHACPYQADVNNDEGFLCTCCEACQGDCADDI